MPRRPSAATLARADPAARRALYQAVCAAPDDDLPRLVFADWLDEHGDPERAEFVRVQCEMARLEERGPRWQELAGREDELFGRHHRKWAKEVAGWGRDPDFRRGFVDGLTVSPVRFAAEGDKLLAAAPVGRARFTAVADPRADRPRGLPLADLLACPHLARLAEVDLSLSHMGSDALAAVAGAEHLRGLRSLAVSPLWADGATAARALLRADALPALTALHFEGGSDELMAALVKEPGFRRVHRLAVWSGGVGPRGAAALARSPRAAGLTHLELGATGGGDRLGVKGTVALAGSRHLANLRTLRLSSQGVGLGGIQAIAGSPHLANLRRLNLSGNSFTPAMVDALVASETLTDLVSLEVPVEPEDAARLRAKFPHAAVV